MITAHTLNLSYIQAVSSYWRGDGDVLPEFDAWLAQFWADCPAEPTTHPRARCPFGGAGRGIRWHESRSTIFGYVPGRSGCYRVPRTVELPHRAGSDRAAHPIAA